MKKEVEMCDVCKENIAKHTCEFCGKSFCNSCGELFTLDRGAVWGQSLTLRYGGVDRDKDNARGMKLCKNCSKSLDESVKNIRKLKDEEEKTVIFEIISFIRETIDKYFVANQI